MRITHVGQGGHVAAAHPAPTATAEALLLLLLAQGGVVERGGGRGGPAPQHGAHHVQVHHLGEVR